MFVAVEICVGIALVMNGAQVQKGNGRGFPGRARQRLAYLYQYPGGCHAKGGENMHRGSSGNARAGAMVARPWPDCCFLLVVLRVFALAVAVCRRQGTLSGVSGQRFSTRAPCRRKAGGRGHASLALRRGVRRGQGVRRRCRPCRRTSVRGSLRCRTSSLHGPCPIP